MRLWLQGNWQDAIAKANPLVKADKVDKIWAHGMLFWIKIFIKKGEKENKKQENGEELCFSVMIWLYWFMGLFSVFMFKEMCWELLIEYMNVAFSSES